MVDVVGPPRGAATAEKGRDGGRDDRVALGRACTVLVSVQPVVVTHGVSRNDEAEEEEGGERPFPIERGKTYVSTDMLEVLEGASSTARFAGNTTSLSYETCGGAGGTAEGIPIVSVVVPPLPSFHGVLFSWGRLSTSCAMARATTARDPSCEVSHSVVTARES